jgi:hypothetical protein
MSTGPFFEGLWCSIFFYIPRFGKVKFEHPDTPNIISVQEEAQKWFDLITKFRNDPQCVVEGVDHNVGEVSMLGYRWNVMTDEISLKKAEFFRQSRKVRGLRVGEVIQPGKALEVLRAGPFRRRDFSSAMEVLRPFGVPPSTVKQIENPEPRHSPRMPRNGVG